MHIEKMLLLLAYILTVFPLLASYYQLYKRGTLKNTLNNFCTEANNIQGNQLLAIPFYILSISYLAFVILSAHILDIRLSFGMNLLLVINSLLFILFGWTIKSNGFIFHTIISRISVIIWILSAVCYTIYFYEQFYRVFVILSIILLINFITFVVFIRKYRVVEWRSELISTLIGDLWITIILVYCYIN